MQCVCVHSSCERLPTTTRLVSTCGTFWMRCEEIVWRFATNAKAPHIVCDWWSLSFSWSLPFLFRWFLGNDSFTSTHSNEWSPMTRIDRIFVWKHENNTKTKKSNISCNRIPLFRVRTSIPFKMQLWCRFDDSLEMCNCVAFDFEQLGQVVTAD